MKDVEKSIRCFRGFELPALARRSIPLALALAASSVAEAVAQDTPPPGGKGVTYSPYPDERFPNQVFFGDTHLHTSYSTDAGMLGNTLGPEEAYRFARGETVTSSTGVKARLGRPLDFLAVTDHAENLGLAPAIAESNAELLRNLWGKTQHDLVQQGMEGATKAFENWMAVLGERNDPLKGMTTLAKSQWQKLTAAAEKYNEPGRFTAFIGFEWTSNPDGNDLHRNVLFRDGKDKADAIVPFSQYDSCHVEDLWAWMAEYEQKTGGRVLAIPHGGNLSNGLMFDDLAPASKQPLDRAHAELRAKWEPLCEVTQMKGTSEAHPLIAAQDELAGFEIWDKGSFGKHVKSKEMLPREYARDALKRGLAYEASLGVNPFKFGMIGSTDSHTSLSTAEEHNFFGTVVTLEPTADAIRFDEEIAGRPAPKGSQMLARETGASGLAAVWARDNTREALWDALARREVYATTGTRLRVRVFAGFDFASADLVRSDFAKHGYARGVPMGGDLKTAPSGKAPAFLVRALRDADGANLDRVQIVKGWIDANGAAQEKVFDVAVSGARTIGEDGRCAAAVGNTVDAQEATYTNAIGAPFLEAYWKDPEFEAGLRAFYYVRVLEIPTPRWTTFDAKVFGVALPKDVPAAIQERAYTSPIWYTP